MLTGFMVAEPLAPATLAPRPGEILEEEFLKPLGLTRYRLAKETGLSETQIGEIIRGVRVITAPTALRLAAYFSNTPAFWLNLQNNFDLLEAGERLGDDLKNITPNPVTAELAKGGDEIDAEPSQRHHPSS